MWGACSLTWQSFRLWTAGRLAQPPKSQARYSKRERPRGRCFMWSCARRRSASPSLLRDASRGHRYRMSEDVPDGPMWLPRAGSLTEGAADDMTDRSIAP